MRLALVVGLLSGLVLPATGWSHFVWIDSEATATGRQIRAGFGEPGEFDAALAGKIRQTKYYLRPATGELAPLDLPLDEAAGVYQTDLPAAQLEAGQVVVCTCTYGLFQRGDKPTALLRYSAKHLLGVPATWTKDRATAELPIECLVQAQDAAIQLTVLFQGKPLPNATIRFYPPTGPAQKWNTDDDGTVTIPVSVAGKYGCYVGHSRDEAGQYDGKAYQSIMDYTTLTFTWSDSAATAGE